MSYYFCFFFMVFSIKYLMQHFFSFLTFYRIILIFLY